MSVTDRAPRPPTQTHLMACRGAVTSDVGDMAECLACERRVRFDLVDHDFFGFTATCEFSPKTAVARESKEQP